MCPRARVCVYVCVYRPGIEHHVLVRRERKKQEARIRALNLLMRMRSEAQQGHAHLAAAKAEALARAQTSAWQQWLQPDPTTQHTDNPSTSASVSTGTTALRLDLLKVTHKTFTSNDPANALATTAVAASQGKKAGGAGAAGPGAPLHGKAGATGDVAGGAGPNTVHDINVHLKESEGAGTAGEEQASEKAFKCFVRAVHSLQSLDLQGETISPVSEPYRVCKPARVYVCVCACVCMCGRSA